MAWDSFRNVPQGLTSTFGLNLTLHSVSRLYSLLPIPQLSNELFSRPKLIPSGFRPADSWRKEAMKKRRKPIDQLRIANLTAAIWRNSAGNASRYNVTFQRSYRDGATWRSSEGFGPRDLLTLAKLANDAHTKIIEMQQRERTENGSIEQGSTE